MADVVKRSLSLALPGPFQHAFLTNEEDPDLTIDLPSPSLVRRHELSLDIAIMLVTRQLATTRSSSSRYCLIDSSPLAGFDWVWSEYAEIMPDKLVEVFDAFCVLHRSIADHVRHLQAEAEVFPRCRGMLGEGLGLAPLSSLSPPNGLVYRLTNPQRALP